MNESRHAAFKNRNSNSLESFEDRYLTEKETVAISRKALSTLRNERHRGEGIPYYKLGRSVRYKLSDVLEYMEERRVVPGGDI